MTTTDYATKIAALLAEAESSTHEAEASAFRDKATELMVKWGVDDAQLADKRKKQKKAAEAIVERTIHFGGEYHRGLWYVGNSVALGLGSLRPFIIKGTNNHTWIVIVGHESDVARAELLINSLVPQALAAMKEWWKSSSERDVYLKAYKLQTLRKDAPELAAFDYKPDMWAFRAKRQFIISFANGVYNKLEEQRTGAVAETGTELVFVGRAARVESWVDEHMPDTGEARGKIVGGTHGAQQHGYRAGQRAGEGATSAKPSVTA